MIDPTHALPIVRQAELLALSRSSVYYLPQDDAGIGARVDAAHR